MEDGHGSTVLKSGIGSGCMTPAQLIAEQPNSVPGDLSSSKLPFES